MIKKGLKLLLKYISIILSITFLCQNLIWAQEISCLATNGNRRWDDMDRALSCSSDPGSAWQESREPAGRAGALDFPGRLESELVNRFETHHRDIAALGTLEGNVLGAEFYFPGEVRARIPAGKRSVIEDRINALVQGSRVFQTHSTEALQESTQVHILTSGEKAAAYHKDNSVLEIHAALLLEDVSVDVLDFIVTHDARHKVIRHMNVFCEEVFNIYLDFAYLRSLQQDAAFAGERFSILVADLEDVFDKDYVNLLRCRDLMEDQPQEFFDKVLGYVWCHCPLATQALRGSLVVDADTVPYQELNDLVQREFKSKTSSLNYFLRYDNQMDRRLPWRFSRETHVLMAEMASFFDFNRVMIFFGTIEEQITKLQKACDAEPLLLTEIRNRASKAIPPQILHIALKAGALVRLYCGREKYRYISRTEIEENTADYIAGYDVTHKRRVYVLASVQNELASRKLIYFAKAVERFPDKLGFFRRLLTEMSVDNDNFKSQLDTAIYMLEYGAGLNGVLASFYGHGDDKAITAKYARIGIKGAAFRAVQAVNRKYLHIDNMLSYQARVTPHTVQNMINMVVKMSAGDGDVLFLGMAKVMAYMRETVVYRKGQFSQAAEDKDSFVQLRRTVEWIYAPLAGLLGRGDIAGQLQDMYLRGLLGPEGYLEQQQRLCEATGLSELDYDGLQGVMRFIEKHVQKHLADLPVRVSYRVKSPYSAHYKEKIRKMEDIFGIMIVITGLHSQEEIIEIQGQLDDRLKRIFETSDFDRKLLEDKGYRACDFKASFNTHYRPFYDYEAIPADRRIEVQIYSSESDCLRYRFGPVAHGLYKLNAVVKTQMDGMTSFFDRDILENIYRSCRVGQFEDNLGLLYDQLRPWEFVGILDQGLFRGKRWLYRDSRLRFVRVPSATGMAVDAVNSKAVDLFDKKFGGLIPILPGQEERRSIPNVIPGSLKTGIYKVLSKPLDTDTLGRMKQATRKPRAFLNIAKLLLSPQETKALAVEGQNLLQACLRDEDKRWKPAVIERVVLERRDEHGVDIGLIRRFLKVKGQEEFYQLLALVNKPGGEAILLELVKITHEYITGEKLRGANLSELRRQWRIKSDKPVALLVHLFAAIPEGEERLKPACRRIGLASEHWGRFSFVFDRFRVRNQQQFYGRLGLDKALVQPAVFCVAAMKEVPYFELDLIEGEDAIDLQADIAGILKDNDLMLVRYDYESNRIYFSQETETGIEAALLDLKDLNAVHNADIFYPEVEKVSREIVFSVENCSDLGRIIEEMASLFMLLNIEMPADWGVRRRKKGFSFAFNLELAEETTRENIIKIIDQWLSDRVGSIKMIWERTELIRITFDTSLGIDSDFLNNLFLNTLGLKIIRSRSHKYADRETWEFTLGIISQMGMVNISSVLKYWLDEHLMGEVNFGGQLPRIKPFRPAPRATAISV